MRRISIKAGETEYFLSGSWKCGKSPSGAHYWIIQHYQMTCRYCSDSRQVNNPDLGLLKPEAKQSI